MTIPNALILSATERGEKPMGKTAKAAATTHDAERASRIVQRLNQKYPNARTALNFTNPLELLVATILSAQCTDERVNKVTVELFTNYRTAKEYADAPLAELQQAVKPTGFFRNKAKAIQGACKKLVEEFNGQVPATMEELLSLPGVARKTANVVLNNAFGIPSGIVVDTHVMRVAGRLGLTKNKLREKMEKDLMAAIPQHEWIGFSHRLIFHGRETCKARKPRCHDCVLELLCPFPAKTG
jgi:endonuclease-3